MSTSNANVIIRDNFPTGLTFGTVTPSEGSWVQLIPEWIVVILDAGEQQSITIEAIIDPNIAIAETPNALTSTIVNTQDETDNTHSR
jgi:hypothetical protein